MLATVAAATAWWWTVRTPTVSRIEPVNRVLLITIDTLRADALGAYGRAVAHTPRIDALAAAGVRFDRARAHNVVTLPSHANILSGRYPFEHGVRDNAGFRFSSSQSTVATMLKEHGYRTAAFVSAFPLDSRFGLDRGFDVYDDAFVGAGTPTAFLVQERAGVETVTRARQWLEAQGDARVFCWVHLYEPHYPYVPPEPFASRFARHPYDGEVAAADGALGPLLDPILTAGKSGHSLVVLTSDHGESLDEHGEATHGIFAYEASIRVPLIFYLPGTFTPAVVAEPARHVDIVPTILDALAIRIPEDLPGRSLLRAAAGTRSQPVPTYFEAWSGALNRGWAPLHGLVQDELKFVDLPVRELYDLERDPHETRNLAGEQPSRVASLRAQLARMPLHPPGSSARSESSETRDRLRGLGYIAASAAGRTALYSEVDDPKNLIALDRLMQDVVGRYLDGDLAGALERCRDLVRRRPTMHVSLLYLGQLERDAGHLDAAVDALEKAAAIAPNDSETKALLGAYLTDNGRAAAAVTLLRPLAQEDAPDAGVVVSYALALARTGAIDQALAALRQAQRVDPSNATLHVHQGTVHLMANDRVSARAEFEKAVALAPEAARAHSSLGILDAEDGRLTEAVAHWKTAVAVDPREHRTILAIGSSLAQRGRTADARPYLEFFAASAPRSMYASELGGVARLLEAVR